VRISSVKLSPSRTSRLPRCWACSCSKIQYPLQVELPPYLEDYRATLRRHPAAQWALSIYRLHRGHFAKGAKRTAAL
jgi:hypothetical protein